MHPMCYSAHDGSCMSCLSRVPHTPDTQNILTDGRHVLGAAAAGPSGRGVLPLPPARYHNGTTMHGMRVVAAGTGASKDLYCDDKSVLDGWAASLLPAVAAATEGAAGAARKLMLSDVVDVDWAGGLLGTGLFACVLRGVEAGSGVPVAVKVIKVRSHAAKAHAFGKCRRPSHRRIRIHAAAHCDVPTEVPCCCWLQQHRALP